MTPQTIIARTDAAIALYGQTVTIQRSTVDANGATSVTASVTCPAAVRRFSPQDLQAGEVLDIRVIVSGPSLGGFVPERDDQIIIDGNDPTDIQQVERLVFGGILCRVNMLCRG